MSTIRRLAAQCFTRGSTSVIKLASFELVLGNCLVGLVQCVQATHTLCVAYAVILMCSEFTMPIMVFALCNVL
jgi:hypothetical protein